MTMMARLRFAPNPTGHLYLIDARLALLNWLYARHENGQFILRIADLKAAKISAKYTRAIMNDLKWLGISWEEGPDIGGQFAPYHQSHRLDIYQQYAEKLKVEALAYPCYCISEAQQAELDDDFPPCQKGCVNRGQVHDTSRPPALRLAATGTFHFRDMIKGIQSFDASKISDFVIVRPDGRPTQDFANAIDDILMQITHVIQEEAMIESTVRQIMVLQSLDLSAPQYTHIPNLLNIDGSTIIRGRRGMSIEHFRDAGFLGATLQNYFGRSEANLSIRSVKRLIDEFELARAMQTSSIWNIELLNQMNGNRIHRLKDEEFLTSAQSHLQMVGIDLAKHPQYNEIVLFLKQHIHRFSQLPRLVQLFFQDTVEPSNDCAREILRNEISERIFWAFLRELQGLHALTAHSFRQVMHLIQQQLGLMGRELWGPINVALTGQCENLELARFAEFIGLEKCRKRIADAIEFGRKLRIEKPDRSNRYMRTQKKRGGLDFF